MNINTILMTLQCNIVGKNMSIMCKLNKKRVRKCIKMVKQVVGVTSLMQCLDKLELSFPVLSALTLRKSVLGDILPLFHLLSPCSYLSLFVPEQSITQAFFYFDSILPFPLQSFIFPPASLSFSLINSLSL